MKLLKKAVWDEGLSGGSERVRVWVSAQVIRLVKWEVVQRVDWQVSWQVYWYIEDEINGDWE